MTTSSKGNVAEKRLFFEGRLRQKAIMELTLECNTKNNNPLECVIIAAIDVLASEKVFQKVSFLAIFWSRRAVSAGLRWAHFSKPHLAAMLTILK